MAEFTYNNVINKSINHIFFELYYKYYLCIFNAKDINPNLKLKIAKKLFFKL